MPDHQAEQEVVRQPNVEDTWGEHGRRMRFLQRVPLFHTLSRELLLSVSAALKPHPVVAGSIVCHEGEPADSFFLIEEGTLTVAMSAGGRSYEVARIGPGGFTGEMALLSGGHRTATVRAETAAKLWSVSGADFRELLARAPELDKALRDAARSRSIASGQAIFELENRNLAVLAAGRRPIRIGRDANNELAFSSCLVSRYHAVLDILDDGYRLRDLNSRNGTYVNGARIHWARLNDGDEIQIADQRLIFDHRQLRRWIEPRGMRVDVMDLSRVVRNGNVLLHDISLTVLPGELVAIVGGSGTGKSTLLNAIAGVSPATSGRVLYNGRDYYRNLALYRPSLGYVPQDDIIHQDLPVRRTLWFAGRLRLPPDTSDTELGSAVDEVLRALDLTEQTRLRVASLSGGQRKRASIGVELLTQPRIFFLDEPTSGLDPATDRQMMRLMRRLADTDSTVILTTHATKNVSVCDKVVFLARGGYLAFVGTPGRALQYFGVEDFDEIYDRLMLEATPQEWAARFRGSEDYAQVAADQTAPDSSTSERSPEAGALRPAEFLRQCAVLSQRNVNILIKNPANLVPLFATPVVIALLLVLLYHAGDFTLGVPNPATPAQILFFLAFSGFFFGLSYGLQEICKEFPVFRRERLVNLAIGPYLLSKIIVLLPILTAVLILILALLRATERLPDSGIETYGRLALTVVLTAFSGLALGLAASAAAKTSEQASIMLPGLVMPQVLFCGVLQPVPSMSIIPHALSALMAMRWSFEALGKAVDLNQFFADAASPQGPPLLQQYGDSFSSALSRDWAILGVMVIVFLALASLILRVKTALR